MRKLLKSMIFLGSVCWMFFSITTVNGESTEWFIGIAPSTDKGTRAALYNRVKTLALEESEPGSVIHVFEVPSQEVYVSAVVPDGPKMLRARSRAGKKILGKLGKILNPPDVDSFEIDLPKVSGTVDSLRQTDFQANILLVGDPLYSGFPHHAGWSMKTGLVPTDTALLDEGLGYLSPFASGVADFPAGAHMAILAHRPDWGFERMHEAAVVRLYRLMCQVRGDAKLIRITDDVDAAFNLTDKQRFTPVVPNKSEEFGMRTTFIQSAQDYSADLPAVVFMGTVEDKPPMLRIVPPAPDENRNLFTAALHSKEHVLVAVRVQADSSNFTFTDADIRVTLDDEEIAFDSPQRRWGSLVKDVRYGIVCPPGEDVFGDNWEAILIDKASANRIEVWLNNYVGIGNITAQVATIGNGEVRTGRVVIDSRTGDEARESAKRSESKRWKKVSLPLPHKTTIGALLSTAGPPTK